MAKDTRTQQERLHDQHKLSPPKPQTPSRPTVREVLFGRKGGKS
jgi:hypothetical protein